MFNVDNLSFNCALKKEIKQLKSSFSIRCPNSDVCLIADVQSDFSWLNKENLLNDRISIKNGSKGT